MCPLTKEIFMSLFIKGFINDTKPDYPLPLATAQPNKFGTFHEVIDDNWTVGELGLVIPEQQAPLLFGKPHVYNSAFNYILKALTSNQTQVPNPIPDESQAVLVGIDLFKGQSSIYTHPSTKFLEANLEPTSIYLAYTMTKLGDYTFDITSSPVLTFYKRLLEYFNEIGFVNQLDEIIPIP